MSYSEFSKKLTRARTQHQCVWCCHPILTGSHYMREKSVFDGIWQDHAWHEACLKDAEEWFDETGQEEFTSGHDMPWLALFKLDAGAAA